VHYHAQNQRVAPPSSVKHSVALVALPSGQRQRTPVGIIPLMEHLAHQAFATVHPHFRVSHEGGASIRNGIVLRTLTIVQADPWVLGFAPTTATRSDRSGATLV